MKAITLLKRVHKTFNIELNVADIFDKRSIRELSEEIDLALEVKELNNASENKSGKSKQIRL